MSVARGVVSVSDLVVVGASGCSVVGPGVVLADVVAAGVAGAEVVGDAVVRMPGQDAKTHTVTSFNRSLHTALRETHGSLKRSQ